MPRRTYLFLQGPISPFFNEIALGLVERGHAVHCIQLSIGDQLFWRHSGAARYRGTLSAWPAFIDAYYQSNAITDIVLLGEQRDYHRIAIEAAMLRSIAVTVTDFGYLRPDWITLERDGMSGHSLFPREPEAILKLASQCPGIDQNRVYQDSFWTMAMWDMLYHLANYFLWWRYPNYTSHKLENPVRVYLGTGLRLLFSIWTNHRAQHQLVNLLRDGQPYYVYPLQMANDFQLRAYSNYPDQTAAIDHVIRSFARYANRDAHLLVKVHPWDPGLVNWRRQVQQIAANHTVTDRVHYVDGGSLDDMSRAARGMVTINSTSGLRALMLNCPVVTLGQAIYDVPGLTFQDGLDEFWAHAQPPDATLMGAYLDAMAATIQIRGVFYARPGLDAAVAAAVERLDHGWINKIVPVPDGA